MRVSPPRVFGVAAAASKPSADSAGSVDAHRQTGFVLGADVELAISGLNLEGAIADASTGARFRHQATAAALGLWSRGWLSRLGALHAVQWGNYVSALALIRAGVDCQAGCLYLLKTNGAEWDSWLADGGVGLAADVHATEYRLHAFRAGEVLAAHPVLGPLYRGATDLSLAHFGATLVTAGSDSDGERIAMTFGDRDFHAGLAELTLGWLIQLSAAQIEDVAEFPGAFAASDSAATQQFMERARTVATAPGRCRLTTIERLGVQRYMLENWRRTPGAATKRLLL